MNSKFIVPDLCKGAVIRENLIKEFDDFGKCFFLSGADGIGKTTLLCLYAKMKKNVFWYSADKSDNDLATFCKSFFSRFASFDEESPNPFDVINTVTDTDLTVIIDNFENITNDEVIGFLKEVMLFGNSFRLFMASRDKMPATFSLLCLNGRLTLIEDDEIAFSRNEACESFGREAELLWESCDGAGVVLNPINAVTPEMYYGRFLDTLDEKLRDFVIKSAFLFRIYPEICRTVLGLENAQKMISEAKNLNTVARQIDGKLVLTYGFKRFCEENYSETALRIRRSACDFCLENGRLKEAVVYCCVSREFDKIPPALKNSLEELFDSLSLEEIEIIKQKLDFDDTYCKILSSYCDFRLKNNEAALKGIESVCENMDFLDRKDRTSVLILKAEILNSLSKFEDGYEAVLAAKATNKGFNSLLSLKADVLETDYLLMNKKFEEAKKLCSDSATKAYVKGEYAYCDIYKLNQCRINLIFGDFSQAQADIKAIDFSRLKKMNVLNRLLIHTAILFDRKNLKDSENELLKNSDALKLLNADGKDIFKWLGVMLELEKAIIPTNGKAFSRENIIDICNTSFESKNRLVFLIFKKVVSSIFTNDDVGILTGIRFLSEYSSPRFSFFAGREISLCLALLCVMKKEKTVFDIVSALFDTKEKCRILYDDIFPVLVYVKAKFNDDYSLYGDIYIERTLSSGAVLTYPSAYFNKALIDYLESKQKYAEIINALLRLSGASPKVKIKTFGGIEIEGVANTDEVIKWRTAKTKELFAYFVHSGGTPIPKAQIVADVFGVEDDKKATEIFNTTMYNLRKTVKTIFGDNIFSLSKGKYSISLDGIAVDVVDFRKFADDFAKTGSTSSALSIIRLYKGAYLKGLESDWALPFTREYEQIFINAAKSYLSKAKEEGKTEEAAELCYIIHNEKCKNEEMTDFLNGFIKDLGMNTELK